MVVHGKLGHCWPCLCHLGCWEKAEEIGLLRKLEPCRQLRLSQAARSSWKLAPGAREQVLESCKGEPS